MAESIRKMTNLPDCVDIHIPLAARWGNEVDNLNDIPLDHFGIGTLLLSLRNFAKCFEEEHDIGAVVVRVLDRCASTNDSLKLEDSSYLLQLLENDRVEVFILLFMLQRVRRGL
jgi:hypothetical protein